MDTVRAIPDWIKEAIYTYVPTAALDNVKSKGLFSGEALINDPDSLALAAQARGESPEQFRQSVLDVLGGWKSDSAKGVNALFAPPPPTINLAANHPLNKYNLTQLKIKLKELLKDYPTTRIHGQELMPYADYMKLYTQDQLDKEEDDPDLRHRDLSPKELRQLLKTPANKLWKHYEDADNIGYYASDVPHAVVITPDGKINPKYIEFPEKTANVAADKLYRDRTEVYALDPKHRVFGGVWDKDKSFAVLKQLLEERQKRHKKKKEKKSADRLYHGSPHKLDHLEPRPSRVLNNERAVFATPNRLMALLFSRPWKDEDIELGMVNDTAYMREARPKSFEQLLRGPSYLYTLNPRGFYTDNRLSRSERISKKEKGVKPLKVEEISDVLQEAIKAHKKKQLLMANYGEQLPWEKEASVAWIRRLRDGLLSQGAAETIAGKVLAPGKFRRINKSNLGLGRGQFTIADDVMANIPNIGGKRVVAKYPTSQATPSEVYAPFKDTIDAINRHPDFNLPGIKNPIAPYYDGTNNVGFQQFANQHIPNYSDTFKANIKDVFPSHRNPIGNPGNIGPHGQIIDFDIPTNIARIYNIPSLPSIHSQFQRPRIDKATQIYGTPGYDRLGGFRFSHPEVTGKDLASIQRIIGNSNDIIRRYHHLPDNEKQLLLAQLRPYIRQRSDALEDIVHGVPAYNRVQYVNPLTAMKGHPVIDPTAVPQRATSQSWLSRMINNLRGVKSPAYDETMAIAGK